MAGLVFPRNRRFDVIPVGRVGVDINPVDNYTTFVDSATFNKYIGGSPTNTAIGLRRLGDSVGFIGKISNDFFGDYALGVFRREGIDTTCLTKTGGRETLSICYTEAPTEQVTNVVFYRDNVVDLILSPEDVKEDYVREGAAIVISGTALAGSPSREACFKIASIAKQHKCVLVFDIDYRPYTWKSRDETATYYSLMASQSDIIMGSREEFNLTETFSGLNGSDTSSASHWFELGASLLIIKHGKEGSNAFSREGKNYRVRPFPIKVVKLTGGGDAYSSALLHGLLHGWPLAECLEFGTASASMMVGAKDCSTSMPTESAIKSFIRERKKGSEEVVTPL